MQKMDLREEKPSPVGYPLTFRAFMWSYVGSLNMVYFGFTMAIYNAMFQPLAQTVYRIPPELHNLYHSLLNCSLCIGVMTGSFYSGKAMMKFGRHTNLVVCDFIAILAETLTQMGSLHIEIGSRWIKGLAIGLAGTVVFLSETAHPKHRERTLMLGQLNINTGFLICFLLGIIPNATLVSNWQTIMLVPVFFPVLRTLLLMSVFYYESPTYQILQGKHASARHTISALYGKENLEEVYEAGVRQCEKYSSKQMPLKDLLSPKHIKPFLLGVFVTTFQQLSGITGVMFYCTEGIFKKISETPEYWSLTLGIVNFSATIFCISLIKKVGKKNFLICGPLIQATSLIILTSTHPSPNHSIIYILCFTFGFCIGLGGCFFAFLGEILPPEGINICFLLQWLLAMSMSLCFPFALTSFGIHKCFTFFAFNCAMAVLFIFIFLPNSKNLPSLNESNYSRINQTFEGENDIEDTTSSSFSKAYFKI